jgi:hypothetical protein
VQRLDVLPRLLQQGDQEVDGQHGVGDNLVLVHVDVTNGTSETKDLLQLELDGGPDLDELLGEVVRVRDGGGELSSYKARGERRETFVSERLACCNSRQIVAHPWKDRVRADEGSA